MGAGSWAGVRGSRGGKRTVARPDGGEVVVRGGGPEERSFVIGDTGGPVEGKVGEKAGAKEGAKAESSPMN